MHRIEAPFTPAQVAALNRWQANPNRHPFTCTGNRMDGPHTAYRELNGGDFGQLIATTDGWTCPVCGYRQLWAHDFMAMELDGANDPLAGRS